VGAFQNVAGMHGAAGVVYVPDAHVWTKTLGVVRRIVMPAMIVGAYINAILTWSAARALAVIPGKTVAAAVVAVTFVVMTFAVVKTRVVVAVKYVVAQRIPVVQIPALAMLIAVVVIRHVVIRHVVTRRPRSVVMI